MIKSLIRTTIRIDNNLKTRLQLLSIKNNISFNKMIIYLLELGYNTYIEKFDDYYKNENNKLQKEGNKNE